MGVSFFLERQDEVFPIYDFDISETQRIVEAHDLLIMCEDQVVRPGYIVWLMDLEEDTETFIAVVESSFRPGWPEVALGQTTSSSSSAIAPATTRRGLESGTDGGSRASMSVAKGHSGSEVLLDSGANEAVRSGQDHVPQRAIRTPLQLADGSLVEAWRNRDGEILVEGNPETGSVICGICKLTEVGCAFVWRETGAWLQFPPQLGGEWFELKVINGLPYLPWSAYKMLRPMITQHWKRAKRGCIAYTAQEETHRTEVHKAVILSQKDHVKVEEERMAEKVVTLEDELQMDEKAAAELWNKGRKEITCESVLTLLDKSNLKPQKKRRKVIGGAEGVELIHLWTFGLWSHGGCHGLTQMCTRRPFLTKVLCALMSNLENNSAFTSVVLARNVVFRPHRDSQNMRGSKNTIVCLNDSHQGQGGEIWVAEPDGPDVRQVRPGKEVAGRTWNIRRTPVTFSPFVWHGSCSWSGERTTLTAYTPRGASRATTDELKCLEKMGFPLALELQQSSSISITNSRNTSINTEATESIHPTTEPTIPIPQPQGCSGSSGIGQCFQDVQGNSQVQGVQGVAAEQSDDDGRAMAFEIVDWERESVDERLLAEDHDGLLEHPWSDPAAQDGIQEGVEFEPSLELQEEPKEDVGPLGSGEEYAHKRPPGHSLKDYQTRGTLKPHRRLKPDDFAQGCLSVDIAGPYKHGLFGFKYMVVCALATPENGSLYFTRPLRTRQKMNVVAAIKEIISQIGAMAGAVPPVVRFHSDNGRELISELLVQELGAAGIYKTVTVPYNPQQNGKAERAIRDLKQRALRSLLESGAGVRLWPYAMVEASIVQREEALGLRVAKGQPITGSTVVVNRVQGEPFEPKVTQAVFLCRDEATSKGALCLVQRNGQDAVMKARLPAKLSAPRKEWRTHSTPSGDLVWVSSHGDIKDADLVRDLEIDVGLVSLEEREGGPGDISGFDFFQEAARADDHPRASKVTAADLPLAKHEWLSHKKCMVCGKSAQACYQKYLEKSIVEPNGYQVLGHDEEADMNEQERLAQELKGFKASAESVGNEVFYGPRREAWMEAAKRELDNMTVHQKVWIEVRKNHLHEDLGLSPDVVLPRPIPTQLVNTLKPVNDPGTNMTDEPKVRLVACGNHQNPKDVPEDLSTNNVDMYVLRTMAKETALHPDWVMGAGDVSAAFLNTPLGGNELILLEPPGILKKLGLLASDTVYAPVRAIYGLKRSPADWSKHRDEVIAKAKLKNHKGQDISCIRVSDGVWKLVCQDKLVGIATMYVDDCLVVGQASVVEAFLSYVCSQWRTKLQGFLARDLGTTLSCQGVSMSRKTSLTFLGLEISFHEGGVQLSQRRWILQEINRRGWIHLRGTQALPQLEMGDAEEVDEQHARALAEARSEIGALLWVGVRSRPDLLAAVSMGASMMHRRPAAVRLAYGDTCVALFMRRCFMGPRAMATS